MVKELIYLLTGTHILVNIKKVGLMAKGSILGRMAKFTSANSRMD